MLRVFTKGSLNERERRARRASAAAPRPVGGLNMMMGDWKGWWTEDEEEEKEGKMGVGTREEGE